jgi:hypothetical protein
MKAVHSFRRTAHTLQDGAVHLGSCAVSYRLPPEVSNDSRLATMNAAPLLAVLLFAVPAGGQSTGANVAGVVTDASGARLADAQVTIALPPSGRVAITTGREGEYRPAGA